MLLLNQASKTPRGGGSQNPKDDSDGVVAFMLLAGLILTSPMLIMIVWLWIFPPEHTKYEALKKEAVQVQIVGINPPKHFYVDLKEGAVIHRKVYVSKHFNEFRRIRLGTSITAFKTTLKHKETGELRYEFDSSALRAAIESSLQPEHP